MSKTFPRVQSRRWVVPTFVVSLAAFSISYGGAAGCPALVPTYRVSGVLTGFVSKSPVGGAVVVIGGFPDTSSCSGWAQCATPHAPTRTAVTASDGTFSVRGLENGNYFMTISRDANPTKNQTYTILHRSVRVNGNTSLGNVTISKLRADESAWLRQLNADRAKISVPATRAVVIDEYDEEASRAEATALQSGVDPYTDGTERIFGARSAAQPGNTGNAYGTVSAAEAGPWESAERRWFAEKKNCPNGSWKTWRFSEDTGHYINLSNSSVVWVGLAESNRPAIAASNIAGFRAFTGILTGYQAFLPPRPVPVVRSAGVNRHV